MEKNTKKAKNSVKTPMTPANNPKGGMLRRGNNEGLGGRPEGSRNRKNIIQELLDMDAPESLLAEVRKLNPDAKTLRDIHTVSTFNRSLKGNPKAMEIMTYYDIGKPIEKLDANMNVNTSNIELTLEQKEAIVKKYLGNND